MRKNLQWGNSVCQYCYYCSVCINISCFDFRVVDLNKQLSAFSKFVSKPTELVHVVFIVV